MRIDFSAGTQSIQSTAARAATTPPGVSAGARPAPVSTPGPSSRVDVLFGVVNAIAQELRGTIDGAEARRIAGPVGVDPARLRETVDKATAELQRLADEGGRAGESAAALLRDLKTAVTSGPASNAHLQQRIAEQQNLLAQRFGFSGHLLNTWA